MQDIARCCTYAAAIEDMHKVPNQDGIGVWAEEGVFVVTDGYQEEGHWFSLLFLSAVRHHLSESPQRWVQETVQRSRELALRPFSGTCFVSLRLASDPTLATVSWLGDSKLFHIRKGRILFETREHTVAEDAIRAGRTSSRELWNAREHHIVSRSVHALGEGIPEMHDLKIEQGDWLLLCSDGVSDNLRTLVGEVYSYRRIAEIVERSETAVEARDTLLQATKEHVLAGIKDHETLSDSKQDNLSLIVLRMK